MVGQLWMRRDNDPFWKAAGPRLHSVQNRDRWVQDHARLLSAIGSRDGDGAYVTLWQHMDAVKQLLSGGEGFGVAEGSAEKTGSRGRAGRRRLKVGV